AGPAGSNGWYLGTVVATASASDPDNAPAQLTTFHAIDGGSAQMYAAPFTLSGDGVHHVSYWSIDPAGNEEAHRLIEVKIDSTRPSVTVSATPSSLWRSDGKMVPVTVSGTMTDSGSGIDPASVRFAVNDSYERMQPSGNVSVGPNGSYAFTVS